MPGGRNINGGLWKWEPRHLGPIAFALQSAAVHNATIGRDLRVTSPYIVPFHIIESPLQFIKKGIYYICGGAALHAIAFNRKTFNGQRQIDRAISFSLANSTPPTPTCPNHDNSGKPDADNQRQQSPAAIAKSIRHAANLRAAGLSDDYEHNQDIGKQHPKAALIRHCLADNPWNPIRAHKAKQTRDDTCPFL